MRHSNRNPPTPTQYEKAEQFRALHHRDGAFIIPNPWEIGTAGLLARLGFEALATTSASYALLIGKCGMQGQVVPELRKSGTPGPE